MYFKGIVKIFLLKKKKNRVRGLCSRELFVYIHAAIYLFYLHLFPTAFPLLFFKKIEKKLQKTKEVAARLVIISSGTIFCRIKRKEKIPQPHT